MKISRFLTVPQTYVLVLLACTVTLAFSFGCGSGGDVTLTSWGGLTQDTPSGGETGGGDSGSTTDTPTTVKVTITSPLSRTELNDNVTLNEVVFSFDHSLNPDLVSNLVTITNQAGDSIPVTLTWLNNNKELTIFAPLAAREIYQVAFSSLIQSADGAVMDSQLSYSIRTSYNPFDIDGDNHADLALGVPTHTNQLEAIIGAGLVWSGSRFDSKELIELPLLSNLLTETPLVEGTESSGIVGSKAANLRDLTGDKLADFAFSAKRSAIEACDNGASCISGNCYTIDQMQWGSNCSCDGAAEPCFPQAGCNAGEVCMLNTCWTVIDGGACRDPLPPKSSLWVWTDASSAQPITAIEASVNTATLTPYALGDLNGDGKNDMAVLDVYTDPNTENHVEKVHLFLGRSSWLPALSIDDSDAVMSIPQAEAANFNLIDLVPVGDVNTDGTNEYVAIIASYDLFVGTAALLSGTNLTPIATFTSNNGTELIIAAAGEGDANGDGIPDVLLGTINASGKAGDAHLFFGGANLTGALTDLNASVTFQYLVPQINNNIMVPGLSLAQGAQLGVNSFGNAVSLTDLTGDGIADVVIATGNTTMDNGFGVAYGATYLFEGRTTWDSTLLHTQADMRFPNTYKDSKKLTRDTLGLTLKRIGDMNHDGYEDLLITGRNLNNESRITSYYGCIFFGNRGINEVNMDCDNASAVISNASFLGVAP